MFPFDIDNSQAENIEKCPFFFQLNDVQWYHYRKERSLSMVEKKNYRPLAEQDKPEVIRIFSEGFASLLDRNNKSDEEIYQREVEGTKALLDDKTAEIWGCYENGNIIGFAALARPNAIIQHYLTTNTELKLPTNIREVRSIYVDQKEQGKGYGRALLQALLQELENKGEHVFCTDAGFKTSQTYWTEIIGTPTKRIEDFWGKGEPHMIWIARTERVIDDLHDPYRPMIQTRY